MLDLAVGLCLPLGNLVVCDLLQIGFWESQDVAAADVDYELFEFRETGAL